MIFFNLIIGCIAALQVFDIAYIVSTETGGVPGDPERSTYFYVLNLYMKSFATLQIGVGSAMAWVFFFVILALTGFNFWAKRYWFARGTLMKKQYLRYLPLIGSASSPSFPFSSCSARA